MPGVNLNINLPLLSDTLATIVAKTSTALSAIAANLALPVTSGVINVNASLPFNGNPATGLAGVQLVAGNVPTAPGYIYYNAGEFYAIDATGVIQITNAGQINAASVGGIVGDYGGGNPAKVTYVNASRQYQFTYSPGNYAALVGSELLLQATSSAFYVALQANGSATVNTTYTLPANYPTVQRPLYSDTSGNLIYPDVCGLSGRQIFTASGTYTPTTGTRKVKVIVVGAGGGGGGAAATTSGHYATGAGGASGVYGVVTVVSASAITGGAVTIGAAGTAGAAGNNAGGAGGNTSVVINGTTYTAGGGPGGAGGATTNSVTIGALAAIVGGGTFDYQAAENGGFGFVTGFSSSVSGRGGSCPSGPGGLEVYAVSAAAVNGNGAAFGYGGGGSGGASSSGASAASGGAGAQGIVIVEEYF